MTPAQIIQRGKGKGRDSWAIRAFLSAQGLNMSSVARLAGTYPQVAQETIRGTRNNRRVLVVLETLGCPENYLYGKEKAA